MELDLGGDTPDDGPDARERAARIARDVDAFADATVERTDDGISVTAETAREHGTDLLVALRDGGRP